MSTGAAAASTDENGSRRSRRGTGGREREMEEVSPAPITTIIVQATWFTE